VGGGLPGVGYPNLGLDAGMQGQMGQYAGMPTVMMANRTLALALALAQTRALALAPTLALALALALARALARALAFTLSRS
jgi:hypothetical protein